MDWIWFHFCIKLNIAERGFKHAHPVWSLCNRHTLNMIVLVYGHWLESLLFPIMFVYTRKTGVTKVRQENVVCSLGCIWVHLRCASQHTTAYQLCCVFKWNHIIAMPEIVLEFAATNNMPTVFPRHCHMPECQPNYKFWLIMSKVYT